MPRNSSIQSRSDADFLRALARDLAPIAEHIRGNESKVLLRFEVPRSLVPKIRDIVSDELERDARQQSLYRHAERIEQIDYAAARSVNDAELPL